MDLFSRIADRYDKIIRSSAVEEFKSFINLKSEEILVDLGGGTGRVALVLEKMTNGCVLLDRSFEMLKQAKKKSNSLILVQGVGEALPFRKDTIPQIFANDTLHHILKQEETLAECYEVMMKSGYFTIREFDPKYWKTKFLIFFEKVLMFGSTFLSPQKLEDMCKEIGFSVNWQRLTKSTSMLEAMKNSP